MNSVFDRQGRFTEEAREAYLSLPEVVKAAVRFEAARGGDNAAAVRWYLTRDVEMARFEVLAEADQLRPDRTPDTIALKVAAYLALADASLSKK